MDIIKSFTKRSGFQTAGMKLIGCLASPFFKCRCQLPPEIIRHDGPIVFVSNHYQLFGPAAAALSLPLRYRFWMNEAVLNATAHVESMIEGMRNTLPILSEKAARSLLSKLAPLMERVLNRFEPLPVYLDNLGKQRLTLKKTAESMAEGTCIVLFPEIPLPTYSNGSVKEFYRSFALIGEYYRRLSGKNAAFCPMYIDKKHRRLSFGSLVHYGNDASSAECEKIVKALRDQMLSMSFEALGRQIEKI